MSRTQRTGSLQQETTLLVFIRRVKFDTTIECCRYEQTDGTVAVSAGFFDKGKLAPFSGRWREVVETWAEALQVEAARGMLLTSRKIKMEIPV